MEAKETNKLILHIEDDGLTLTVIKLFLRDLYKVEQAKSSEEAIEMLKTNKVDLILMDIAIFGEMNGLELTKKLKGSKKYSHIPIIIVTVNAFDKVRKNAFDAGCADFIIKPFPKAILLDMIAKYI